jgi:flagellar export protein FliJ
MSRSFRRLSRVRELLEDEARLELETKTAEMRELEDSAERQRQWVLETRAEAVKELTGGPLSSGAWRVNIADGSLADRRRERFRALAEMARPVVEEARQKVVERRRERRQVEILCAASLREEAKCERRQEQNRTDDWFQSGPKRPEKRR